MSGTAEIISYTVETGIDEKALTLSNAEAARKLEVGTSWTKIRIGMLLAFDNSSTTLGADSNFSFGLINDASNGIGSATPDHFFGIELNQTSSDDITYNSTSTDYYFTSINNHNINHIVNGSVVTSDSTFKGPSGNFFLIANFASEKKNVFMMDIEKGGSDWTVVFYRTQSSGIISSVVSVSEEVFDDAMVLQDPTNLAAMTQLAKSSDVTITAPDEATNGNLDHFTVYFQNTTSKFVIPTIKVSRFS